ncbi:MAG: hypothetical protein QM612_01360 [Thermomonas sp.]|uniref:ABC transporter permease n=1 Tax=Thermomonas sp. TaxID=1971895 RepID=UPI0039E4D226
MFLRRAARSIEVAAMLVRRELVADFEVSRMSLLWPIGYPLAYTLLVVFMRPVFGGGFIGSHAEFGMYVFVGFCIWHSWFEVLRRQMDAVKANKSLVTRAEIGSSTLFLITLFYTGAQLVLRLVFATLFAVFLLKSGAWAIIGFVAFALVALLNGAVIGALLQPFSTLSPDFGKGIQSISLGLLITGAVFFRLPAEQPPTLVAIVGINPMGALLNLARAPLFGEAPVAPLASYVWIAVTFLLLAVVLLLGRRVMPILIERIGN